MDFELVDSEILYSGRVITLRIDKVRTPEGKTHAFETISHNDAVTILPFDPDNKVWFVRQYRHPAGNYLLELPAGVAETGEDPRVSAMRELREEIGMAAGSLEKLGGFWMAPGYSTEYMHVFVARNLYESPLPGDEDESIEIEKIDFNTALNMAETGQFEDSKTLIALLWASRTIIKGP